MLSIDVTFKVVKVSVLLAADRADAERVDVGVGVHGALVTLELLDPRERLVAELARVRPLAGVSPRVLLERRRVDELLAAHRAAERQLARVPQHVRLEVALLVEAPMADDTGVRSVAGVFCHVFPQSVGALVRPAAQVTAVWSLTCKKGKW